MLLCAQYSKAGKCSFLWKWPHLNTQIHSCYLSQELVIFSIALLSQLSATFFISAHPANKSRFTVTCWSYVLFGVTILWCRHGWLLQDSAIFRTTVLCASADCVILQNIRDTSIAPTRQFRL